MTLILYTTAGCHLCELADTILQALNLTVIKTEIGDDDDLVERYGVHIPVIKFPDRSELSWPFELQDIEHKLSVTSIHVK